MFQRGTIFRTFVFSLVPALLIAGPAWAHTLHVSDDVSTAFAGFSADGGSAGDGDGRGRVQHVVG